MSELQIPAGSFMAHDPAEEEEDGDLSDENLIASGCYVRCHECGKVVHMNDAFIKHYDDPNLDPDDYCNQCAIDCGFIPEITRPWQQATGAAPVLGGDNQLQRAGTDGMFYTLATPNKIVVLMEALHRQQIRVTIHHGDPATGAETYRETGYIGKTTGAVPIPILVYNKRSMGGTAVFTESIVRVEATGAGLDNAIYEDLLRGNGKVFYVHPKYHIRAEPVEEPSRIAVFLEQLQVQQEVTA